MKTIENLSSRQQAWRPLLTGRDAKAARSRIESIADALNPSNFSEERLSRLSPTTEGTAGIALFFGYLSRVYPNKGFAEIADWWSEVHSENALVSRALFGGLVGRAWVTAHFDGVLYEIDNNWSRPLDDLLIRELGGASPEDNWDLVKGLSGAGVYFLERLPAEAAAAGLRAFIDHVEKIRISQPDGTTWRYHPNAFFFDSNRELAPEGVYNLTTAHGILGIMAVLAGAVRAGIEVERAGSLLEASWRWLWSHLSPEGDASAFPISYPIQDPSRGAGQSQRLCWCRGDLGSAAVTMSISNAVGNDDWKTAAESLGIRALKRRIGPAEIKDPGICHGAAGAAHLANRLYQATESSFFRRQCLLWIQKAVDLCDDEFCETGGVWSAQRRERDGAWGRVPMTGFLLGSAGVGLALLAATSEVEPNWDRLLLLSTAGDRAP